eukprot:CCRYP_001924-RC/>CCRYP_001924-RC protein AED:0.17 eAED:0.17 QI:74/1/1/1/0.66/0.57/7/2282/374
MTTLSRALLSHRRPVVDPLFLCLAWVLISILLPINNTVDGFCAYRLSAIKILPHGTRSSLNRQAHPNLVHKTFNMSKNDDDATSLQPIRAGFIGCGTIAYSIASGLANPKHAIFLSQHSLSLSSICVTRRSESRSTKLKDSYPDVVTVYDSAEEVVKNSEVVFLCVLPQHVDGVLGELTDEGVWNEDVHTLVSLVSTSKVDDLIRKTNLPPNKVYKMICLPPIAQREGCALLQPPASNNNGHPYLKSMLDALGGCVECANDDIMNAMMIPGCLMGPMYGIMRNNRDWLVKQGVPPEDASYFIGRTYLSIVQDAERDSREPARFDELIQEQTPGGLNEQSLRNLEQQGVFDAYNNAMNAILSRLEGKSDGSLPSK